MTQCPMCGADLVMESKPMATLTYYECTNGHSIALDGVTQMNLDKKAKEERMVHGEAKDHFRTLSPSKQNYMCVITEKICDKGCDCRSCRVPGEAYLERLIKTFPNIVDWNLKVTRPEEEKKVE